MARAGKKPGKRRVEGGVGPHSPTHHAAVALMDGARSADAAFPATTEGDARVLARVGARGRAAGRGRRAGAGTEALLAACARRRPAGGRAPPGHAPRPALRSRARRCQALTSEITALDGQLTPLVTQACPTLLAIGGVGTETAAQLLITCGDNPDRPRPEAAFAALCGASPIPASSGKTNRHRLNRGGHR